jgi:large subunit ribosomal protein L27
MAHKKGAGQAKNGRDSQSQRLGIKIFAGQDVNSGAILVRQHGTHILPGLNVGVGKDHTIFSLIDGKVQYEPTTKDRRKVSVYATE